YAPLLVASTDDTILFALKPINSLLPKQIEWRRLSEGWKISILKPRNGFTAFIPACDYLAPQ
ncbi:hypothetical protein B7486_79125, partial [cyanobacterium TDX16]